MLTTLQTRAVSLLDAASYFADIAVIEISDGTIASRIQTILTARGLAVTDGAKTVKRGLACIIGVHAASIEARGRLRSFPLLRVAVLENPLINRATGGTGKLVLDVCVEVFRTLHNQPVVDVHPTQATTVFSADGEAALSIISQDERRALYGVEGGNAWHCNFRTTGGIVL
jgi:hypothetical protein